MSPDSKRRRWVKLPLETFSAPVLMTGDCGAIYPWLLVRMCMSSRDDGALGSRELNPLVAAKDLGIPVEIAQRQLRAAFDCGLLMLNRDGFVIMHGFDLRSPDPFAPVPVSAPIAEALDGPVKDLMRGGSTPAIGKRKIPLLPYAASRARTLAFNSRPDQTRSRPLTGTNAGADADQKGASPGVEEKAPPAPEPKPEPTDYTSLMIPGSGELDSPTREIDGEKHYTVMKLRELFMRRWPDEQYHCRAIYEFCREISAAYPCWVIDAVMRRPLREIRRPYGIRGLLGDAKRQGRPRAKTTDFQADAHRQQLEWLARNPAAMDELIADCLSAGERPPLAVRQAMRERLIARGDEVPELLER